MTDTERAEYDDVVRRLTAKCEELVAENARLRSDKRDALSFLEEVFNDPNALPAHRLKAAGLVLPHQVPRLEPVPPPLELTAEPVIPLAELVAQRRARQDAMEREMRDIEVLPNGTIRVLPKPGGNGSDDDTATGG
jgi:hypothetical protein